MITTSEFVGLEKETEHNKYSLRCWNCGAINYIHTRNKNTVEWDCCFCHSILATVVGTKEISDD